MNFCSVLSIESLIYLCFPRRRAMFAGGKPPSPTERRLDPGETHINQGHSKGKLDLIIGSLGCERANSFFRIIFIPKHKKEWDCSPSETGAGEGRRNRSGRGLLIPRNRHVYQMSTKETPQPLAPQGFAGWENPPVEPRVYQMSTNRTSEGGNTSIFTRKPPFSQPNSALQEVLYWPNPCGARVCGLLRCLPGRVLKEVFLT